MEMRQQRAEGRGADANPALAGDLVINNSIWLNYLTLPPNRHVIRDNALLLSAPIWINSSPRNEIQRQNLCGGGVLGGGR